MVNKRYKMAGISTNIIITYLKDKNKTQLYPRDTKNGNERMDEFNKAENKEMKRGTARTR